MRWHDRDLGERHRDTQGMAGTGASDGGWGAGNLAREVMGRDSMT